MLTENGARFGKTNATPTSLDETIEMTIMKYKPPSAALAGGP
jgi:hypothetical protein